MARKLPVLQRVLGAPTLFSVAYGEIASSIYFALGIIAGHALGLTPQVLLLTGLLFLVVALSYAEGITAIPETGGAATLVRKAFNDFAGFCTGWVLFLDYIIVITLSALFLPHYLGGALEIDALQRHPWDVVVGVAAILAIAVVRLFRRPGLYTAGIGVAVLDLVTQLLVVVLGLALLFSPDALTRGVDPGSAPSWSELAFALPLAMLAYTGLETVANLAEEARRPGIDIPRSLFGAIGVVVALYIAIAVVGLSAFPVSNGETALGGEWLFAPLLGIVEVLGEDLSPVLADALRVFVGVSGALILLAAATTSVSGFGRLAYSLGEHGMLPRTFGRLGRRTLISPAALASVVVIAAGGLIAITAAVDDEVAFLAALFSFGVLLAFAAAQLAVIALRFTAPELERPYRVPGNVRVRGADVPIPAVVGIVLTLAVWVAAMITHSGARYAGPDLARGGARHLRARAAPSRRGAAGASRLARRTGGARGAGAVEDPRADEARADRRGDGRDGGESRPGTGLGGRGAPRYAPAAFEEPRRAGRPRRGGARGGVSRGGAAARRGPRRRGQRRHGPGALDRGGHRQGGHRAKCRPDRARLGAALAPAVPLLLADGRVRPAQRSLRGARRRLPRVGAREEAT